MEEDEKFLPLDDRGPNKLERQIVAWALASPSYGVYYAPRAYDRSSQRYLPHAVFRSVTDREPLATGHDVLWALEALEGDGVLDKTVLERGRASYRLTELGRQTGTASAIEK